MGTEDVHEPAEILAFMKTRGFKPPMLGQGGPRRGPARKSQPLSGGERYMPPNERSDIRCVDCDGKGHAASECKQARLEKDKRPWFACGKIGHIARE